MRRRKSRSRRRKRRKRKRREDEGIIGKARILTYKQAKNLGDDL